MKKKMIKRSLALGALMAFVITGSAMANSFTEGGEGKVFLDESGKGYTLVTAPETGTIVNKNVNYKLEINPGKVETCEKVASVFVNSYGQKYVHNGNVSVSMISGLTGMAQSFAAGYLSYGGDVTFNNNVDITAKVTNKNGKTLYGLYAYGETNAPVKFDFNGDKLTVNAETIVDRTGKYTSQDKNSRGEVAGISAAFGEIVTSPSTNIEVNVKSLGTTVGEDSKDDGDIELGAAYAYGLLAESGIIDLKGSAVINVASEAATATGVKVIDGYYTSTSGNNNGNANVTLNNAVVDVKNNAVGGKAVGMEASNFVDNNADEAELTVNGNLDLTVTADTARGVIARDGKKVVLGSKNSDHINIVAQSANKSDENTVNVGIWAVAGGEVDVNTKNLNVIVKATGENSAYGISAQNNSTPADNKDKFATVNIKADNIYVESTAEKEGHSSGLVTMSQGQMYVNGNLEVHADNAIVARGGSTIEINKEGQHTTKLNGDMNFNYDKATSGTSVDANVLVNLSGADSYWTGNSKVSWSTGEPPKDYDKVTGIDLRINDGATWNPTYVDEQKSESNEQGTVAIAQNKVTMDGGIINISSANMKGQAVKIESLKGESGTIKVDSLDKGQLSIGSKEDKTKLTVNGNGAIADQIAADKDNADKLANVVTGKDGNTAANKVTTDEGVIGGRFEGVVDEKGNVTGSQAQNSTNVAISEMGSIALMAWRQENNDMNKRLGELRNSNGEHGIWTRMTRGESEFKSVKNQYNAYQIGYDEKLSTDKSWTVGAALTYTDAQSSFAGGSGENTHKGFAVYGSKLNEDGSFIDLIAKYARLEHEFDAVGGIGKGEYDTNGYSVSAEYGKRFDKGNGFWVEPQVELTYGKVGSVNYATDKAMAYQDGMESLVGRVGFSLGKDIKDGNVYVRASYLYDFDGETQVTMMSKDGKVSDTYEQDLGGGWFEVGVGTNINLSDATYVYFDVEKTYGGDVATPWQWNAGVRYSF